MLSQLSTIYLGCRLPKLKFEKDIVCASCRHNKMVASSHPFVNSVMTDHPCELLHMHVVGPAWVCSVGGKWFVLVIVDDFLDSFGS